MKLNSSRTFIKIIKRNFGIGSFYSKYVILGSGFAGISLTKLLTTRPFAINPSQITLIDLYDTYCPHQLMRYNSMGLGDISNISRDIKELVSSKIIFRQNEIYEIDPQQKLLLGSNSLRITYDKLIMACGLEPDFIQIPGLTFALEDFENPLFSMYEYASAQPKWNAYSTFLFQSKKLYFDAKIGQKFANFSKSGQGNVVFSNYSGDLNEIVESLQTLILLHDLLKGYRGKKFLEGISFIFTLPIKEEEHNDNLIYSTFIQMAKERGVGILFEHKLKAVQSDQILEFDNNNRVSYDYCVVTPGFERPFVMKSLVKQESSFDEKSLKLKEEENVYYLGDVLSLFLPNSNRNVIEIYNQAEVLSNNLKVYHFRLKQERMKEYKQTSNYFYDFAMNKYYFFKGSRLTTKNKNILNRHMVNQFYYHNESYIARKFFMGNFI